MAYYNKICFLFCFFCLMNITMHAGQILPAKDTLLKQMTVANKYLMDKWPDPGVDIVTDKKRPSNIWTRATYYEGLMKLYFLTGDTNYYQYAVEWGESHAWKPAYEYINTRSADNQCCGQTYIELYQLDPKPERIEPIKACIDSMMVSKKIDDWWWIDAIQMAMPVFAKLGMVYKDTSYFRRMNEMYMFTKTQHGDSGLYNKQEHLWWRDMDFDPPYQTSSGKNCYWSRGNGWVLAALARVLDVMPDTLEYWDTYITTFQEMSEALIQIQREDGFWNPSLVDENDYGGKETSGTAFFTFGLAWGIHHGILDSLTYTPIVIKAWNGMVNEALHRDGFLGYVQGTGKQPSDGQPLSYDKAANFEDYGLGAFLLAGSEVYYLAPDTGSIPAFPPVENPEPENIYNLTSQLISDFYIYPNPVKEYMTVSFGIQKPCNIKFNIFSTLGEKYISIEKNFLNPGKYDINWDCNNLSPGIYYVKLQADQEFKTYKLIISQ